MVSIHRKGVVMRRNLLIPFGLMALLLSSVAMGGTAFAVPAAHAAAAISPSPHVTCSKSGCNNTDPYATGCASNTDPSSKKYITHVVAGDAFVWLVYSPACGTNWTELDTTYDDHVEYFYGQINRASGPDGGTLSYSYSSSSYTWLNTNQVYAPNNQAQACGAAGNAAVNCTGFV
jgi:hypothetical protein